MTIKPVSNLRIEEIRNFFIIIVISFLRKIHVLCHGITRADGSDAPENRKASVGTWIGEVFFIKRIAASDSRSELDRRRDADAVSERTRTRSVKSVDGVGKKMLARSVEDVDEIRRLGIGARRARKKAVAERDERLELLGGEGARRRIEEIAALIAELFEAIHANLQ